MIAEKRVSKLLSFRAYIFTCSYRTAWDNWLEENEKEGFAFEDMVLDYKLINFKGNRKNENKGR